MSRNNGLMFAAALAAGLLAGTACAAPSFNCATAKTLREKAVCGVKRLANFDQEIAGAYARALERLDRAGAAALRKDQRDFISAIDDGFERGFRFSEKPEDALNELIKDREGTTDLEDEMKKRLRFLRSLEPRRQMPTGRWQNADTELTVTREGNKTFAVEFFSRFYGFPRYNCDFKARFTMDDDGLKTNAAVRDIDDKEVHTEMTLRRSGATLVLREDEKEDQEDRVCSHPPNFPVVLFPVTEDAKWPDDTP